MKNLSECLMEGYYEYLESVQLEFQKTDKYQELHRKLDENKQAIENLKVGDSNLNDLIRQRDDLQLELYAICETQTINALVNLIHR